jgi:hypothetical protein
LHGGEKLGRAAKAPSNVSNQSITAQPRGGFFGFLAERAEISYCKERIAKVLKDPKTADIDLIDLVYS